MPAKKKIVFFALDKTFGHSQIGGTDSYMRRLTGAIINSKEVEWVFYDAECNNEEFIGELKVIKFIKFKNAIDYIWSQKNTTVITSYIDPKYRLYFGYKRLLNNKKSSFYLLMFFYPESYIKKIVRALEILITPYAGVITVSNRLNRFCSLFSSQVLHLPPIVPFKYNIRSYHNVEKPTVVFLGRIDPRKGINEVFRLFKKLAATDRYRLIIYGIAIEDDTGVNEALNKIKSCSDIEFIKIDRGEFSEKVDDLVINALGKADFFIQPYKNLESTVDTPLLLLEATALKCEVLTTGIVEEYSHEYKNIHIIKGDFPLSAFSFIENYRYDQRSYSESVEHLRPDVISGKLSRFFSTNTYNEKC